MISAILGEMKLRKDEMENESIDTIYFGGGTPSILKAQSWQSLFDGLSKYVSISSQNEITVEANPEDINQSFIENLGRFPVSRISLGVQSFDEKSLKLLGRAHSHEQAKQSIIMLKELGSYSLNVDLIFGLPGRELRSLESDLELLEVLEPNHISAYSLTIEKQTKLGRLFDKKEFIPLSDEGYLKEYQLIHNTLAEAGYLHYEISNYCKPDSMSLHNSSYWTGKPYIGLGPSAHSFRNGIRSWNIPNNGKYISEIRNGILPIESEELTPEEAHNEKLMLKLRTIEGINLESWEREYGYNLYLENKSQIKQFVKAKWVELKGDNLNLSIEGWFRSDEIVANLFLEDGELNKKLNDF